MDATTFITKKHDAAVEELKAIEAEYLPKLEAAKSAITMTKKWLDELTTEVPNTLTERQAQLQEFAKGTPNGWASSRDLTPQARTN